MSLSIKLKLAGLYLSIFSYSFLINPLVSYAIDPPIYFQTNYSIPSIPTHPNQNPTLARFGAKGNETLTSLELYLSATDGIIPTSTILLCDITINDCIAQFNSVNVSTPGYYVSYLEVGEPTLIPGHIYQIRLSFAPEGLVYYGSGPLNFYFGFNGNFIAHGIPPSNFVNSQLDSDGVHSQNFLAQTIGSFTANEDMHNPDASLYLWTNKNEGNGSTIYFGPCSYYLSLSFVEGGYPNGSYPSEKPELPKTFHAYNDCNLKAGNTYSIEMLGGNTLTNYSIAMNADGTSPYYGLGDKSNTFVEVSIPSEYFAKITNAPNGILEMYSDVLESGEREIIKTFPNDWILKVYPKTVTEDGWIKVKDMTDESEGWVEGGLDLFPYLEEKQGEFESVGSVQIETKADRATKIVGIINHYYNNTDTTKSLYSSDGYSPKISLLKNKGFPVELLLAIIAQESGGKYSYDNEIISFDYGHGITQVTFHSKVNYKNNRDDPRGISSKFVLQKCRNVLRNKSGFAVEGLNEYLKCYKGLYNSKGGLYANDYDNYDHDPANPKYKQYTNTLQSMSANIKDGLGVLSNKYGNVWAKPCSGYVVMGSLTFSCSEISIIKAVWGFNGALVDWPDYLGAVASKLKNLTTHFEVQNYSNSDSLIEKLAYSGSHRIELKAHSPIEISIKDSKGNVAGVVDGKVFANIDNSEYDPESERAVVFFPDDASAYTYEVIGDSEGGAYGLDIEIYDNSGIPISFNAVDLPIIPGEKHIYKVDQEKLKNNDPDAVAVTVDKEGDGLPEYTLYSGNNLNNIEKPKEVVAETIISLPTSPAGSVLLSALPPNVNHLSSVVLGVDTVNPTSNQELSQKEEIQTIQKIQKKKNKSINKKDKKDKKDKKVTVLKKTKQTIPIIKPKDLNPPAESTPKKVNWLIHFWQLLF